MSTSLSVLSIVFFCSSRQAFIRIDIFVEAERVLPFKWEDSFRFYEYVYSDESLTDEQKNTILTKITRCSQAQKKQDGRYSKESVGTEQGNQGIEADPADSSILSLDTCAIHPSIGHIVSSWTGRSTAALAGRTRYYRVTDLLHVGSSSLVVELEEQDSGKKYAGQSLSGPAEVLSPERLAAWVQRQLAFGSRHLVRTYDLAGEDGHFFIVREHLPISLSDLLTTSANMPVTLAVRVAYQVLEALGDLHLHMTAQGVVRNQFHLDLRPSRVLLRRDKPYVKLYNGGLWTEIDKAREPETNLQELPVPHLAYRAPEQFRPYLARKRPPGFTDIYLFGTLFYEMLAGAPAFKASSFGEYEIQHCEQYPSPPKVWRPEIPEILNELIMKCLASDPVKRFRSTTQISLILEKAFPAEIARPRDDAYQRYLQKLNL